MRTFIFFTAPKVGHLTSLVEVAEGVQIVQLQNRLVDHEVVVMLGVIRFPLKLNNPEADMVEDIWRGLHWDTCLSSFILPLDGYRVLDNRCFMDEDKID
jgi:hypothetical protein